MSTYYRYYLLCKVAIDYYYLCIIIDNISSNNILILKEKTRIYCDFFKILLKNIELQITTHNTRQRDSKNIVKLLESFALEDCNRLQSKNYIFNLINRIKLLLQFEYSDNNFNKSRTLTLKKTIFCLNNYYCIQATREFLAKDNR